MLHAPWACDAITDSNHRIADLHSQEKRTPLHCAAKVCDVDIAQALLKAKADPNAQDKVR